MATPDGLQHIRVLDCGLLSNLHDLIGRLPELLELQLSVPWGYPDNDEFRSNMKSAARFLRYAARTVRTVRVDLEDVDDWTP